LGFRKRVPESKTFYRNLRLGTYTNREGQQRATTIWETTCGDCGEWFEQFQVNRAEDTVPTIPAGKCCKRCPDCREPREIAAARADLAAMTKARADERAKALAEIRATKLAEIRVAVRAAEDRDSDLY
jgi:hypothetical protein